MKNNLSGAPKGNENGKGNRGKIRTIEQVEKMRRRALGKIHSEETKHKLSEYWQGRKRPKSSGLNHWNWQGGIRKKSYSQGISYLLKKEKEAGRSKPSQCELCTGFGKIVFDHDHLTGKFRGWLCQQCNVTLGFVKEDINRLKLLISYLENNGILE